MKRIRRPIKAFVSNESWNLYVYIHTYRKCFSSPACKSCTDFISLVFLFLFWLFLEWSVLFLKRELIHVSCHCLASVSSRKRGDERSSTLELPWIYGSYFVAAKT